MQHQLSEILKQTNHEPKDDLGDRIWYTIQQTKERERKIRLWSFTALSLISFIALIPSFNHLSNQFTQTSFFAYFKMMFSDSSFILQSGKEFLLLLGESLPVMSIVLFLGTVLIFFGSLRITVRKMRGTLQVA